MMPSVLVPGAGLDGLRLSPRFCAPGQPIGTCTEPSKQVGRSKARFGSRRRARWFGLGGGEDWR